jgi:hypothetical protein
MGPQNPSLDGNDDGGATFPITLPAGVTEAYIQVIDYGPESGTLVSCNGSERGADVLHDLRQRDGDRNAGGQPRGRRHEVDLRRQLQHAANGTSRLPAT